MKILIIDDDEVFLQTRQELLAGDFGNCVIEIAHCTSVEQVLNAVTSHKPDIIFLDHRLTPGGFEGFVVAKQLREQAFPGKIFSSSSGLKTETTAAYNRLEVKVVGKHMRHVLMPLRIGWPKIVK